MKASSKKSKQLVWRILLVAGLIAEFILIGMAIDSMVREGESLPHWQSVTFMAIAVWIYIAYLKQRSLDISKFAVDEKIKTHLLAQHLSEGLIVLDGANRVLLLNSRAAQVMGVGELAALEQDVNTILEVKPDDWLAPGRSGECAGAVRESGQRLLLRVVHMESESSVTEHKLVYVRPIVAAEPVKKASGMTDEQIQAAISTVENLVAAASPGRARLEGMRLVLVLRSLNCIGWEGLTGAQLFPRRDKLLLTGLLDEVLADLAPSAEAIGVNLNFVHADPGLRVDGAPEWFKAAVCQVVLNAVLCSAKGQTVQIKSAPMGMHAGLAVDDSVATPAADGMNAAFIWPYAGLHQDDGAVIRGESSGLFMARQVLEKHGGMLSAEPRPEGGLRVTLMLPG